MEDNKLPLMSGRLAGTRTLASELEKIEKPDEIEKILKDIEDFKTIVSEKNEIINIKTEKEVKNAFRELRENNSVGIYTESNFENFYITTNNGITYVIPTSKENMNYISSFLSSEKIIKYILNDFSLIKWCHSNGIEPKSLVDLVVYLKVLTNSINPYATQLDYIKKHSPNAYELISNSNGEKDKNIIITTNFILSFGNYLGNLIEKLTLDSICRIIHENSYYEYNDSNEKEETCSIRFSFVELDKSIEETKQEIINIYKEKAYLKSPLGRVALKFGNNVNNLVSELCIDDLELKVLNYMFNNNLKVKLLDENLYEIHCKYKSFSSVIGLGIAIMKDTFYTLYGGKIEIKIEGIVKE